MIKTVIKRSGSEEAFNPEKLNRWGEWASRTLKNYVDWGEIVLDAAAMLPEKCSSKQLQEALIKCCLDKSTWEYNLMAGRLYAALMRKEIYGGEIPTVQDLHVRMVEHGVLEPMDYDDDEYDEIEQIINHDLDFHKTHYELQQLRYKYAIRDKVRNIEFETPQFIYMRMAMALAESEPRETRMRDLKKWYEHLSMKRINAPTPYYTNLGTGLKGYASCCVYTATDTGKSLAAGDHIAYMMTLNSAGIGAHIKTRSIKDPVRNGIIEHQGKIPYYRALAGAIGANLQNGRGGAATMHYTCYDPEVNTIIRLKNAMTPLQKQVRGLDYSFGSNRFFAEKVAKNEEIALFSYKDAPELYEAQYESYEKFVKLYEEFLASGKPRVMVNARDILIKVVKESLETGRHYLHFTDTMNKHTPFKEKIYSSNLCQEIALPTAAFRSVEDLYKPYYEGSGEIATCNLAGIIVSNIESDEMYAEVAYYALKMIDKVIHMAEYPFKNLRDTATARLNAGVGMLGVAHLMAKKGLKYSSQEGKNFLHELAETHAWHLYNASLKLGQELGNAPWIHKTKWVDGWLPIDTYEKNVDSLVTVGLKRDWEDLRRRIKENGGIRNSCCIAHMPGESSTIAAGTTNGIYPIRDFDLIKTSETMALHYVVPESTKLRDKYEIAWDIPIKDMIECYAIVQKFTDQAISADLYRKLVGTEKVGTREIIQTYLQMVKYGLKTRYYFNSMTAKGIAENHKNEERGCNGGVCTL